MNRLYYGDNLEVLRKYIPDESVDLVYLDPPFNSKADYNILYKEQNGTRSASQIKAFSDFWHWDEEAQKTYEKITSDPRILIELKKFVISIRDFLGSNDMSAYLIMMAVRLVELHRVLKKTGSLYLHCDSTASHYLKLILDSIFGVNNFRNEITWRKLTAAKAQSKYFSNVKDSIFLYTKSGDAYFNPQFVPGEQDDMVYPYVEDNSGRRYGSFDMTQKGEGPERKFGDKILKPPPGKHWIWSQENIDKGMMEGRIFFTSKGLPRVKRYLDEKEGNYLGDVWMDKNVAPLSANARERLGYDTQKPLALLERIVNTSSKPGDLVLDPFCGCGTTLDAAEHLHREWIGIDITHLAINVIKKRLKERYPGVKFDIIGEPRDLEGARELAGQDRYQFQWWVCSLIAAAPYENKKKGADTGIDCVTFNPVKGTAKTYYGIVQVKSGNVNSSQIRDFKGTIEREKADYGIFLTLEDPTEPMKKEAVVAGHFRTEWNASIPKVQILTIKELLEEHGPEYPFPPDNYNKADRAKRTGQKGLNKQITFTDDDSRNEI